MVQPEGRPDIEDGTLRAAADSAEGVASVRAIAAAHSNREGAGVDHLAIEMLSPAARSRLPTPEQLEAGLPDLLHSESARVAFFDDYLLTEARAGVNQAVILASGLDTRPYRFRDDLRRVTVFEVDRAPMLEVKSRRTTAALDPVDNVRLAAVDLADQSPASALEAAGLNPREPVAVLCCGISMYLPAAALDVILRWVGSLPVGSSIAIDYVYRRMIEGDDGFRGAAQVRARLATAGEVQVLGFDGGELAEAAQRAGLAASVDIGPGEIVDRYLRDDRGAAVGEPLGYHCLAILRRYG